MHRGRKKTKEPSPCLTLVLKEHDLLPWAKYLCQLDHKMAEAANCRLLREHTLVAGDEECDYWIVGGEK